MIFAASLVVRNELDRYLPLVLQHLRGFCDQITILDDHSSDGTFAWLLEEKDEQVSVAVNPAGSFDQHEGRVRQRLLEMTLARAPTHVLAIDADEFVHDGRALRHTLTEDPTAQAWTMNMTEVWNVSEQHLHVRADGGWRPHETPIIWRVPPNRDPRMWRIADRKLACPRIPMAVARSAATPAGQRIYHFGWADPATRQARYDRYMRLDRGRFHARSHLASIAWPDSRITFEVIPWPDSEWADPVQAKLLA
jgi:hypothetical protein